METPRDTETQDSASTRSLWTNGTDTFVADSFEHLRALYVETYGYTMEEMTGDPQEPDEWYRVDPDSPYRILWEGIPEGLEFASVEEAAWKGRDSDHTHKITATARAWAQWHSPGFLCSTEY